MTVFIYSYLIYTFFSFFFFCSYDTTIVADGMTFSGTGPAYESRRPTNAVNEQISALRSVTAQLRNAYDGHDVEFIDSEEPFDLTGAAAGSGSGFPATDANGDGVDDLQPSIDGSGDYEGSLTKARPAKPPFPDSPPTVIQTRLLDLSNQSVIESSTTTSSTSYTSVDSHSENVSSSSSSSASTSTPPLVISNGDVERPDTSARPSNSTDTSGGTSVRYGKLSLNAALASYLLPTVVIWIGRSFNDWLCR